MSQSKPLLSIAPARPLRLPLLLAGAPAWVDCLILAALAAAIRSIGLDSLPFWTDEMFTIYWSQLPVKFLLGLGAHIETNPPAYYVFMHGWMALFGNSPLAVQLPSLIFSSLAVPVAYLAAKTLSDRKTALLAGVFIAVNPFLVAYAQETRVYALLGLANTLAFLALAVYLRHRAAGAKRVLPWLALFVLAVSAGPFLHYTSLVFLLVCFLVAGLDLAFGGPPRIRPLLAWVGIAFLTAALITPQLILAASLAHSQDLGWIAPFSLAQARYFLISVAVGPRLAGGWPGLACASVLALMIVGAAWRPQLVRGQALLLLAMPALLCALLFAAAAARPILIPRIGIFLPVPLSILLAHVVTRQKFLPARAIAGLTVLAALLAPLSLYLAAPGKEDWDTAARIAMTQPACSGPVLYVGDTALWMIYYQPALARRPLYDWPLRLRPNNAASAPATNEPDVSTILHTVYLPPNFIDTKGAAALIAAHPHTMLVLPQLFASAVNLLPRPLAFGVLRGGLVVACY